MKAPFDGPFRSGNAADEAEKREIERRQLADPDAGYIFEILISTSATPWPASCTGVRPVVTAVQKMLEAASAGRMEAFQQARIDMEETALQWEKDLFETEREP